MKLFVTGASGYIGSEFVKVAKSEGHIVTNLGRKWRIPYTIFWLDYDAVIHFAAAGVRRNSPHRTWNDCIEVNFGGTRDLLQAIVHSGATPTVFISGTIREEQTRDRPDYWHDPYIVSQKLRRVFVEEWARGYLGKVVYPFVDRCGTIEDVQALCHRILKDIQ